MDQDEAAEILEHLLEAARIQALVEADRLEGDGYLRKWRRGVVRLKG